MKKLNVLVMGLLLPMLAAAQTVKSPNGNVSVTFSLTEKGQPTYEMSYKGKTVCKPSHLGLELAKDKHASKGMESRNRRHRASDDRTSLPNLRSSLLPILPANRSWLQSRCSAGGTE